MAAITERFQETVGKRFNWEYWLQDNITGSTAQTIGVIILTLATLALTGRQWTIFPTATLLILILWLVGIVLVALEGLHIYHSRPGRWLKSNLDLLRQLVGKTQPCAVRLFPGFRPEFERLRAWQHSCPCRLRCKAPGRD